MDLKEIKSKKRKLEFDILHLLTEFQKETKVCPEAVHLDCITDYDMSGSSHQFITGLKVEARI